MRFASCREVSTAAKLVWNLRTPHYFRQTWSAITVGISTFGGTSPKALNCCGFRNITEQREQAENDIVYRAPFCASR
jgi:hypothetical protein